MLIQQLDTQFTTAYKTIRLQALCECPVAFNSSYEEETNTSAISLYKSFGFEMFGIEPFAAVINGVPQEQMHMVRLKVGCQNK